MTPPDFVTWMKGVAAALRDEPPTPERWARILEQLSRVSHQTVAPYTPGLALPSIFDLPKTAVLPHAPWPIVSGKACHGTLDISTEVSPTNG